VNLSIDGTPLAYGRDFVVAPFSPARADVAGDLVFAGYGAVSAALNRDDLAGLHVADRVVLLLGDRPPAIDAVTWQREVNPLGLVPSLAAAGARAVLVVNISGEAYETQSRYWMLPRISARDATAQTGALPALLVSDEVADRLVGGLTQVKARASAGVYVSRDLGRMTAIAIRSARDTLSASNVVALLRGTDAALASEAVVVSAHHDGFGAAADGSIYSGAGDDALGVGELVAVAEALARGGAAHRRSVVFLVTTGEEHGLLGARHWLAHPAWPLDRVVADFNFDMVWEVLNADRAPGWKPGAPFKR
jgi:hypothetical protein